MTAANVQPRLFRGMRDLLPEEMSARQKMIDTIRGVYESYGFVPLATPAIEHLDVLVGSGGQESNKQIFEVKNPESKEKEDGLGLRFDLTVPLARVISQYKDLPRPFRRYQVADVWRMDKPGPGRFRQFTQFDVDSVGVSSDLADVEIIAAMCDTLTALNVGGYRVRFSSRRVLNLLLSFADISGDGADVFRVLDKLDKIGPEKMRRELTTGYKDESGDTIAGLGLRGDQVDRIEQFLAIRSESREEVLAKLRETMNNLPGAGDEINVLERISGRLKSIGYEDDRVSLDLSVARGLAYYTGPVFEAILTDAPQYGSVFGGGRYDDLVLRFLGERVPAVGASIGVDRLLAALIELGRIKLKKSTAQVLVAAIDPSMTEDYLAMTFELRRAGIPTELYLGDAKMGKQVKYANALDVPIVLLVGSNERDKGVVTLKDMQVGRMKSAQLAGRDEWLKNKPGQVEAPRAELVATVKRMLAASAGGGEE